MNTTSKPDGENLSQLFKEPGALNEARRTLAWFNAKAEAGSGFDEDWRNVRARMNDLNVRDKIQRMLSLTHDFWVSKRANPKPKPENYPLSFLTDTAPWNPQLWQPPDDWRCWPTFDVESEAWLAEQKAHRTNALDMASIPAWTGDAQAERARGAELLRKVSQESHTGILIHSHAVAWIDIAIGRLGRLMCEGPLDIDPRILLEDFAINVIEEHKGLVADMMEDSLGILYGSARRLDGQGLASPPSPRGQSFEWREYFQAIGADLTCDQVLAAVQLAALGLRSESVWSALNSMRAVAETLSKDSASLTELNAHDVIGIVMCVRRRWHLALRALAWLEMSLQRTEPFKVLRPADLACFAITSLLPQYPRPVMAVSHRSCDMKAHLLKSRAWRSNEVLIDAAFRPEWQTNRAMVWSLFSATPVICKMQSERYAHSNWCEREAEMFEHLRDHLDFFEGRYFLEINASDVGVIESPVSLPADANRISHIAAGIDYPPFELNRWSPWQGALVRAGAVAKFVHRFCLLANEAQGITSAEISNKLLEMLVDDKPEIPEDSFWGFDRILQRLAAGLRADAKALDLKAPLVTVTKPEPNPSGQDAKEESRDELVTEAENWFERHWITKHLIIDPAGTDVDACDLLAALDWREHLEKLLTSGVQGSIFENQAAFIDLRGATKEEWMHDPGWTVARGLIYLRLPYPLLIRQLVDQGVEAWPMIRDVDLPIFTQHLPDQTVPQSEVFFFLHGTWPAIYFNAITPKLTVHPLLHQACYEASKEDDCVYMRADKGLSALSLRPPGTPGLEEWLRNHRENKK